MEAKISNPSPSVCKLPNKCVGLSISAPKNDIHVHVRDLTRNERQPENTMETPLPFQVKIRLETFWKGLQDLTISYKYLLSWLRHMFEDCQRLCTSGSLKPHDPTGCSKTIHTPRFKDVRIDRHIAFIQGVQTWAKHSQTKSKTFKNHPEGPEISRNLPTESKIYGLIQ